MLASTFGRRDFLKLAGLSAGALLGPKILSAQSDGRRLPNIVLYLADDMGYGDPQFLNPISKIPTPFMNRLAGEGMIFTDAHAPASACTPTRYGILTGRYCWRTRLKRGVLKPWDSPLIDNERLTLPAMLKLQGYASACIGKWHLGWDWPTKNGEIILENLKKVGYEGSVRLSDYPIDFSQPISNGPTSRGFNYFFGVDVPNYPPYCFIENDQTIGVPNVIKSKDEYYGHVGPAIADWKLEKILPTLTRKAVDFIDNHVEQHREAPFFMYFASTAPHTPIVPSEAFQGRSGAGPYGDLVHEVDWTIGQLMESLERNGLVNDTIFIVTSDNGSPGRAGDPHTYGKDFHPYGAVTAKFGHEPNWPWRGMKQSIWEGGHRIPLIVRWPGRIKSSSICTQTVCLVDFMATLAKVVRYQLPDDAGEDSYDISPLWYGLTEDAIREATVLQSSSGGFCIRQGRWKLVTGLGRLGIESNWSPQLHKRIMNKLRRLIGEELPNGQLYDMQLDPREQTNLWNDRQDIVQQLTDLLESYKREGRSVPRN